MGEGEGDEGERRGRKRERERERDRQTERKSEKTPTYSIDNIIGVGKSFPQIQWLMWLVLMHQLTRRPLAW